jgi:hypothetical protein
MRTKRTIALLIVALAALVGFAVGSLCNHGGVARRLATETTIAQVREHAQAFAGRRIKLSGQLDECFGWECSICPESMTARTLDPKQCLALNFRPLIAGTGFGSEEQETVFRFADVVLTAKFDPSCWHVPCVDRQTVLDDAEVISVGKRRASKSGLWMGEQNLLTELGGSIAEDVKGAAYSGGYPKGPPVKVFRSVGDPSKILVCWTELTSQPGSWPTSLEGAYARSTSDFYRCNEVRKIGENFVLQTDGSL